MISTSEPSLKAAEYVPDLSYHRERAAAGRRSARSGATLTLSVAKVTVALRGLDEARHATLAARYGIFAQDAEADFLIDAGVTDRDGFLTVATPSEMCRVDIRWEGSVLLACSYEWAGWLDETTRRGGLTLARVAAVDPGAFDRSVENFLRVVYAHAFVPRGGLLLHGSGLVLGGRAFVFFGPSGAGKTTVTELTPEALVLSDDLTALAHDGQSLKAGSVPFRGKFAPQPATNRFYEVAGLFKLVQDSSNYLEPLRGARAVGEVVASLPFVLDRPEMAGAVVDNVAAAAAKVPIWRLHFKKERTFWQTIEAACGPFGPPVDDFDVAGSISS